MSLPTHSSVKSSRAEWIGHVPTHWREVRLKFGLKLITEKASGDTPKLALENIESWTGRFLSTETEFEGDGTAFVRGDVLFGKLRPYLAKALLADEEGQAVGDFHVLRPTSGLDGRFALYYVLSRDFIAIVDGSTYGAKMPRASWEFMSNLPLPLPPLSEQTAIAAFLDRETGKIDALVEEQRRLIELLKEKRQAVISHAVTKGLDPNARMKPSGIEWLGDVPEHWELARLDRVCDFRNGKAHEPFFSDDGPFICVTARFVSTAGLARKFCTEQLCTASKGDILMVMSDLPNGRALARAYRVEDEGPYAVNQRVCALTAREVDPAFLFFQLDRNPGLLRHDDGLNQTHLSNQDFLKLPVLVPPPSEQREIARQLTDLSQRYSLLVRQAEEAVGLLQERRATLISAAVTGKIDVRGPRAEAVA